MMIKMSNYNFLPVENRVDAMIQALHNETSEDTSINALDLYLDGVVTMMDAIELHHLDLEAWSETLRLISAMPKQITTLRLMDDRRISPNEILGTLTDDKLLQFYETISELDLEHFSMSLKNQLFLKAYPSYGERRFSSKLRAEDVVLQCISYLPKTRCISLPDPQLLGLSRRKCVNIYAKLSERLNLDELNLSLHGGIQKPTKTAFISEIPSAIKTLIFQNQLGFLEPGDQRYIFSAFPQTIEEIDLQHNLLHRLSVETLEHIANSSPLNTYTVYLSSSEVNAMTYEQLTAFANVLQNAINIVVMDKNEPQASDKITFLQSLSGQNTVSMISAVMDTTIKGKVRLPTVMVNHSFSFFFPQKLLPKVDEIIAAEELNKSNVLRTSPA